MDLRDQAEQVATRQDLVDFIATMMTGLEKPRIEWENDTLDSFLDSLRGWTQDMDGYFRNIGEKVPSEPSWNLIAQMLLAATVYE